jgi:hypothetical protein
MKSARNIPHHSLDVHKETIAVSLRDLTHPSQLPTTVDRTVGFWSVTTDGTGKGTYWEWKKHPSPKGRVSAGLIVQPRG